MKSWLAVAVGASVGAWIRWGLSVSLNGVGVIPLGTFLANAIGGLLMGVALGILQSVPNLSPEWRLLMTTGFLGGLTTFSTFSAEAFTLMQKQNYGWAVLHISSHVIVSIVLTMIGYWCVLRWQ
ncbi:MULTISPECIES: fluoride efflux transporter CrcB [unclassified Methylophilus]|jgi:fluoride exporter|uniref:fluoride efflux transporter CrcB n=1 Tax=unclassified Methylophilus TaxID=2630143 RepID=UPI0006F98505|nr:MULTISPECIES: fluoride efflux transporter CrcB [unclassified Methylophilus]KQT43397.1 camphor resistance protein CrcB [Methylophilus sp. Leaf416]KQT58883.1 camphor resistance protein CrcB [Methylophilus sp. Leaf459]